MQTIPQNRPAFPRFLVLSLVLLSELALLGAERDPAFYRRQSTWQETLMASERALAESPLEDGLEPFESRTFTGGAAPQKIEIDVAKAQELWLFVSGCPDVKWGVGDWADAVLRNPNGGSVSLSSLSNDLKRVEGRCEYNMTLRSGLYEPMRMSGVTYTNGLNVQAYTALKVHLGGRFSKFQACIGVDDWAGTNGSIRFSVTGARTAARKRLWELVSRDFPDGLSRRQMRWEQEDRILEKDWIPAGPSALAKRYADACGRVPFIKENAGALAAAVADDRGLAEVRELYYKSRILDRARRSLADFDVEALRLAMEDLSRTFPKEYANGAAWLADLRRLNAERERLCAMPDMDKAEWGRVESAAQALESLRQEALLANPLLQFEKLLLIKRKPQGDPRRSQWEDRGLGEYIGLPKQSSWHLSTIPKTDTWENEIAVLSPVRPEGALTTLYKPSKTRLLTDIDLDFSGGKMLFSMPDDNLLWQVHELGADGKIVRQLTPQNQPDVHNYDSCYLPNGNIAFMSTAVFQGVPCNAQVNVGTMYLMNKNGGGIHQVCFDQDHDYCPTVLNNGRVLYLRWDYTDTPHVWNRILMSMNPDGTGQMEHYGSGSYWPNAVFFARPVPNHPTKIAGIVTGHHEGRVGELVVFDPSKGSVEAEGVVQRIPGRGKKVAPIIEDKLTEHSWPKYLHPWPLNENYYIVACKPEPDSLWGVYLVDTFDNRVLIREEESFALLEPIPFRPTPRPPVLADRVIPEVANAVVLLQDVYEGPGLKGVPRGTVKSLRVFTYHFAYQNVAGIDHRVGADGPWEVKRVLGTVPVEDDGSASFRVPAKYPLSFQPLDADGMAVGLMRSWVTAMPGEVVSCIGCHARLNNAPPVRRGKAFARNPSDIQPWHDSPRGFSFVREVQPVLDKFCVGCHGATPLDGTGRILDLRSPKDTFYVCKAGSPDGQILRGSSKSELMGKYSSVFEPSFVELRKFIRVGGFESDLHILTPLEFHAGTSELVQILKNGHHGVELDADAWDRIITWIDLNAPCNGTWKETTRIPGNRQPERRRELRRLYGGIDEDDEEIPEAPATAPLDPVIPKSKPKTVAPSPVADGWPFDATEAKRRQTAVQPWTKNIDLGNGNALELVRIPAGSFVMGTEDRGADEMPRLKTTRSFWIGKFEISNEQFAQFDPEHDSRFEDRTSWIFSEAYLGWPLNRPRQPVVRVSWLQAHYFCQWLAGKTGLKVTLPTETQWEYACRAGSSTDFGFGGLNDDFSLYANMADASLRKLATEGWRPVSPDLVPRDDRFNDRCLVTADVGAYLPNAWGLYDMHGNAAEWTRSTVGLADEAGHAPDADLENPSQLKVVRGGSWRDRPHRCSSSFRQVYPAFQRVFNVGFRVVIEE